MKKTDVELDDEISKVLMESVILYKALFDLAELGDSVSSDVLERSRRLIKRIIRLRESL